MERMNFWQYLMHTHKTLFFVVLVWIAVIVWQLLTYHGAEGFGGREVIYWFTAGSALIWLLIIFKWVQGYNDYRSGKSR